MGIGVITYAQQGELHHNGGQAPLTFAIDSASASIDHFATDFYIVNTGSVNLDITTTRVQQHTTAGWSEYVCDCDFCPLATGTVWESPSNPSIAPGDSCLLQPKVYPNDIDGCAIYTYHVEAQNHVFIDSVQITFTIAGMNCFLGENELEQTPSFSVYPNPATDIVNVSVNNMSGNSSFILFDIVGKEIMNANLINGVNPIDVSNLTPGVYFYSIKNDNNIIETKKVVIK